VVTLRKRVVVLIACSLFVLSGCGKPAPSAVVTVKTLQSSPITLPQPSSVTTVWVESDSAAAVRWNARSPSNVMKEVLTWLGEAQPVSVSVSIVPADGDSGGYTGPARLLFRTKDPITYEIVPVYYSTYKKDSHGNYVTKYLESVVEVDAGGYQTYFRSPALFSWLKNDEWKQRFIDPMP
jgi:hypothetical protein